MELDIDTAFTELGLTPGATEAEVKAAWRRLVSQWHPDRNPSAAAVARMQRINHCLEAIRQAGFSQPNQPTPQDKPVDPAPAPGQAGATPHRSIHRKVRLTLAEAAFGCTRVLRGRAPRACSTCVGVGHVLTGGHCAACGGSGAIRQGAWFGWMGTPVECEACHGGGLARQACTACKGSGKVTAPAYQARVRFPQGVRDGDLLSVQADPGRADELLIRVEVKAHPLLVLDADGTLRCEMPVDGFAWIANRTVEVPTLEGLQTLALQREQLSYRLKGQGFPVEPRGPRGDLLVTVSPLFPQPLSTDQQILIDQLIASTSGPGSKHTPERLRRWQQALRGLKPGRPPRR